MVYERGTNLTQKLVDRNLTGKFAATFFLVSEKAEKE